MITEKGCYYCERDEEFLSAVQLCDLKMSKVFFLQGPDAPGRCTIMFKDHYEESTRSQKKKGEYMDDVCALANDKSLYPEINTHIWRQCAHGISPCPKTRGKVGLGPSVPISRRTGCF